MPTLAAIYRSWLPALGLIAVIVSAAGCKSDGSCEELFDVLKECDESFKEGEEKFLQTCRAQADGKLYKAYLKCSVKEECVDYQECVTGASNNLKAAERAKELKDGISAVKKDIESGAFRNADGACKRLLNTENKAPELATLCNGLAGKAVETIQKKLTQLRDSGGGEGFFALCYDHKYFARKLSDSAHQEAALLCKEVDVARTVTKAVAQAKAKLKKKDHQLPFDCGLALKDLKNLKSAWAVGARSQIMDNCYLKLGHAILAARVPTMKQVCKLEVKKVYRVLKKLKLKNESLSALMKTARPLCSR